MNLNEKYKKISWVYQIAEIWDGENFSNKRLDSLSNQSQTDLIFKIFHTINKFFGQMPGSPDGISLMEGEKIQERMSFMLETWLSGLCDLSVSQIISGLLDILNLKTEYQKWPPKSVIEFYAVCKACRPSYHEKYEVKNNIKKIENNSELIDRKIRRNQCMSIAESLQALGRSYEEWINKKITILENKKNRSENEEKILISRKKSLEEFLIKKNDNI